MTDNNRTTLLDEKIKDAREDVAKAEAKLAKLLTEQANRSRTENVKVGDDVNFEYGRGDKRRVLTGTIVAVGNDEKLGKMLAVQAGEGLDVQTYKIRAADIVFAEAPAAAQE